MALSVNAILKECNSGTQEAEQKNHNSQTDLGNSSGLAWACQEAVPK